MKPGQDAVKQRMRKKLERRPSLWSCPRSCFHVASMLHPCCIHVAVAFMHLQSCMHCSMRVAHAHAHAHAILHLHMPSCTCHLACTLPSPGLLGQPDEDETEAAGRAASTTEGPAGSEEETVFEVFDFMEAITELREHSCETMSTSTNAKAASDAGGGGTSWGHAMCNAMKSCELMCKCASNGAMYAMQRK